MRVIIGDDSVETRRNALGAIRRICHCGREMRGEYDSPLVDVAGRGDRSDHPRPLFAMEAIAMPSFQTFFRTVVMVACRAGGEGWQLYGPTDDQVKTIGAQAIEMAQEAWTSTGRTPTRIAGGRPRVRSVGSRPRRSCRRASSRRRSARASHATRPRAGRCNSPADAGRDAPIAAAATPGRRTAAEPTRLPPEAGARCQRRRRSAAGVDRRLRAAGRARSRIGAVGQRRRIVSLQLPRAAGEFAERYSGTSKRWPTSRRRRWTGGGRSRGLASAGSR